jgi:hypothetical protein
VNFAHLFSYFPIYYKNSKFEVGLQDFLEGTVHTRDYRKDAGKSIRSIRFEISLEQYNFLTDGKLLSSVQPG